MLNELLPFSLPALTAVFLLPVPALIVAAYIDVKSMVIPNWLTFSHMAAGILATTLFNFAALPDCLLAMVMVFIAGSFGIMGMGDIKLLMAIASVGGVFISAATIGCAAIYLVLFKLVVDNKATKQSIVTGLKSIVGIKSQTGEESVAVAFAPYIMASYISVIAFVGLNAVFGTKF